VLSAPGSSLSALFQQNQFFLGKLFARISLLNPKNFRAPLREGFWARLFSLGCQLLSENLGAKWAQNPRPFEHKSRGGW
jgi:hypothetical protein